MEEEKYRDNCSNDSRTPYLLGRDLTGSATTGCMPVKDKNGKTLMTEEQQNTKWVEHFSTVHNQPYPSSTFDFEIKPAMQELVVAIEG